ncbi:MAG: AEC family transporter, partial [Erysipelotrichaceae bacterium]|nr:AEC family transporter [Erysipelotrichaceae bacterium]
MQMSLSLATQIGAMFIMVIIGYILIKLEVVSIREIRILSLIVLYVGAPCAIVNSFLIELTADRLKGFLLAIGAAVVVHVVYLLLSEIFG